MGNAAIRKVPEDLTKCSDVQLRCMINSVIINNPWNEDNDQSEDESLNETIEIMRQKGFRPITPKEYVDELKRLRKELPHVNQGVKVWIPIGTSTWSDAAAPKKFDEVPFTPKKDCKDDYSTSSSPHTTNSVKLSIRCTDSKESCSMYSTSSLEELQLPCSREDAAQEILRSGASDAVLSELTNARTDDEDGILTEEWPTNGVSQKYHRKHLQF